MTRTGDRANRRRVQDGLVLPTAALVASIVTVAVAAVGFVLTSQPEQQPATASPPNASVQVAGPTPTLTPKPHARQRHKPAVEKKSVYVEVFNNSNIHGLAGRTAATAQQAGWNVVGSDNWYGTVDATTIYFPRHLRPAGAALAKDLHISTLRPAISPMKLDRLTVILTADYRG